MQTIKSYALFLIVIKTLLITFALCSSSNQQSHNPSPFQPPSGCTADQLILALNSINTCQNTTTDITTTLKCIAAQITKNSSQQWNVFLKNSAQNSDVIMYWTYDNCSINLETYGKYDRNYVLWPIESYLAQRVNKNKQGRRVVKRNTFIQQSSQTRQKHIQTDQPLRVKYLQDPNVSCPQWKLSEANNVLKACDISGNNRAAECIVGRLRDQLSQNWNVLVATTLQSDAIWYSFNSCTMQVNFGTYGRRIYLWKANF